MNVGSIGVESGHVVRSFVVGLALQDRQEAAVADGAQGTRQANRTWETNH